MRSSTRTLVTFALFITICVAGRTQTVTGTTTADIDPNTGVVTVTCETDLDSQAQAFYGAQVGCSVQDGNGNIVAADSYDDIYNYGYAQVVLTFQGTPGNIYFADGSHLAFPVLLRDQPEGQPISYDDYYFFEQLYQTTELGNSYTYPGIFSFYGPGPDNQTTRGVIKIADTTDSVANPAPRVNAQIDWIGPITATDLFYSTYVGMMGSNQLGLYGGEFGPGATGCVIGTEGVGTVTPRDATGPITLKRIITSMACFASENGVTPIPCPNVTGPLPADDTGDKITTDPQLQTPRGPAGGQVFNMDVPGITYDTTQPIITSDIIRVRYNFVTYAVDSDGKTVISQKVPYFVRLSCRFFNGTANLVPVNVVDNSINLGTTPITWNLQ